MGLKIAPFIYVVARLYLVGLGLAPPYLTRAAEAAIREADCVFAEVYTSYFDFGALGINATLLDRRELEDRSGAAIEACLKEGKNAALLVPGDPMAATAHSALVALFRRRGYEVVVVPGVSIVCAAFSAACLSIYKLGGVATITYPRMGVLSARPYEVAEESLKRGLHALLLLDVREGGGFMAPSEAAEVMLELERREGRGVFAPERRVIAVYRLGWPGGGVARSTVGALAKADLPAPAAIIVPGGLNPVEKECIETLPVV
nr:MAG: diphthine synthase [Thermoproteus sp. AZ2]